MDFTIIFYAGLAGALIWAVHAMFMRPSKEPADKLPGSDPYLDAAGGGPDVTRHLGDGGDNGGGARRQN